MENNLMKFEGNDVEVFEFNGQVLFNPKHVAKILDIKNVNDNLRKMNKNQVIKLKNSDVGKADIRKINNAGENFLTESGVYKLVFKSKKPEAERFSDWIADEVLPSIRKHGAYMTEDVLEKALMSPDFLIKLATQLKQEKEAREKAEKIIEEQKPLVDFANKISDTTSLININQMAKLLQDEDISIGRNRLFDILRKNKILMANNQPYQKYIENGFFKIKEGIYHTPYGTKTYMKTLITGKGQIWITEKLRNLHY